MAIAATSKKSATPWWSLDGTTRKTRLPAPRARGSWLLKSAGYLLLIPGLLLSSFAEHVPMAPQISIALPVPAIPVKPGLEITELSRSPDLAPLLVDESRDFDKADLHGRTPLMWAASNGHVEMAKKLIEAGADIHKKDQWGQTALSLASQNNHRAIVNLLFEAENFTPG
ncbi:MAG: ankyrin repeat domain-containing protein [Magnetococcales bacterium]|nr:ankyrin repeat domain-containing protein [Magnetococcales bacterium]